ncbi:hypothetical protein [Herbaspirillum rubrisubalbicans]|uniref:Uncharacterized protein n=1 Tax=Herbaspirillum rubrisubalbicans TaxID=80842 RepID=A0AAD0XGE6_9BURK|nr:hypothetical protein [Herbaspirillum rubrisubalbicans]AYR23393.1 hypothetical protein RC54_05940 [Herbaspirillum rubrisubalbicans]
MKIKVCATALFFFMLSLTSYAWSWGCQIESAGQRSSETQRPSQSRVTLYVGEVGKWGDLQARLSKIDGSELVEVDVKAPEFSQRLQLAPNAPHTLQLCGKEVMITLNGLGNTSATFIVSVF